MLSEQQLHAASAALWEHWQQGRRMPGLPEAMRPTTRAEGYAVQALLEARSAAPLWGWKIAATSQAGQKHIGTDGPLAGRLLRERVYDSGAQLPLLPNQMRVIEPEFAFRMARDLPPRATKYSQEEVLAAVGTLHPAIEIPDSRYDDFPRVGAPQLIADNACAHLFVLGPATSANWRSIDLAEHRVTATVGSSAPQLGKGANVLGDPRIALTWLANELSQLGVTLKAGQSVTTGTCLTPITVAPGDHVRADFGVLGQVEVNFAP